MTWGHMTWGLGLEAIHIHAAPLAWNPSQPPTSLLGFQLRWYFLQEAFPALLAGEGGFSQYVPHPISAHMPIGVGRGSSWSVVSPVPTPCWAPTRLLTRNR